MKILSSDLSLLPPLPGELLSSVVARSHLVFGYRSKTTTMIKALGTRKLQATAPYNLCLFSDPFTAYQHTVLPYYLCAWPLNRQTEALKTVFQPYGKNLNGKLKLNFRTHKVFKKPDLSFCPLCLLSDLKTYGMPYFHTLHQLQGVTACPEHRVQLSAYSSQDRGGQLLAVLKPEDYQDPVPASSREILYSSWASGFIGLSQEYLNAVYHCRFLEIDECLFSYRNLYRRALDFFGSEYLEEVGCLEVSEAAALHNKTIASFASAKSRTTHPFYHFMLWEMMGLNPEDFRKPVNVVLKKKRFEPYKFDPASSELIEKKFGVDCYLNKKTNFTFLQYHPLVLNDYKMLNLVNTL